jgi:hypothetical protein
MDYLGVIFFSIGIFMFVMLLDQKKLKWLSNISLVFIGIGLGYIFLTIVQDIGKADSGIMELASLIVSGVALLFTIFVFIKIDSIFPKDENAINYFSLIRDTMLAFHSSDLDIEEKKILISKMRDLELFVKKDELSDEELKLCNEKQSDPELFDHFKYKVK